MSKAELLEAVQDDIIRNLKCPLKTAATNLVFGKGNPDAPILFIGEAPGEKEDLQGIPFVGSAGKQLDKMLNSIGLTLDACYVANILKYRPPNNREPQPDEMLRHTPYLIKQIDIIKPAVIVTLGNFSTKFVLSGFSVDKMYSVEGVGKLHGQIQHVMIDGRDCVVIPLYHPAACLYNPNLRETLMQDFQVISQFLKAGDAKIAQRMDDALEAKRLTDEAAQEKKDKEVADERQAAIESNAAAKESTRKAGFSQETPSHAHTEQRDSAAKKSATNAQFAKQPKWKPDQKGLGGFF